MKELKDAVCQANLELVRAGLVVHTWGNVSGVDRERGLMVIKPSGVPYEGMNSSHMVTVELATGNTIDSTLKPSSDTATHLELYRAFPEIGGIVHTHSLFATAWAQAKQGIPSFGTTQADYWFGDVPCTRLLNTHEIRDEYELHTGKVIVETFDKLDYRHHPGVLVASHGPFAWGKDPSEAVHNAIVLEYVARLASETLRINADIETMQPELLDKHFLRKHGPDKYYGQ